MFSDMLQEIIFKPHLSHSAVSLRIIPYT